MIDLGSELYVTSRLNRVTLPLGYSVSDSCLSPTPKAMESLQKIMVNA